MANDDLTDSVDALRVKATDVTGSKGSGPAQLTLEAKALLLCTDKVASLETDTKKELQELRQRQTQVRFLHRLLKGINASTDKSGNFDCSNDADLRDLIKQAKDMGVDLDVNKTQYNKDERDRMIENIRLTTEDLNIQNEMQLQSITRLTNERYEVYQMARAILKPLHDDKINKARAAAGR